MEAVTTGEDVMAQAIAAFIPLLEKRLSAGIFTTEDSVRYTFFAALLQAGVAPEQVILEARYKAIARAELDLLISSPTQEPLMAAEFKYDRAIPGGKNLDLTRRAGKLFADLSRLLLWHDPIVFYFIYLTDRAMYNYLCNTDNKVSAIFTLTEGEKESLTVASFNSLTNTFHTAMGPWTHQSSLRVLINKELLSNPQHHLWIFSIQADQGDPHLTTNHGPPTTDH